MTTSERIDQVVSHTTAFNNNNRDKLKFILVPSPTTVINNENDYFKDYLTYINNTKPFEIDKMINGEYLKSFIQEGNNIKFIDPARISFSEYFNGLNPINLEPVGFLNEIAEEKKAFYKEHGLNLIKG